MSAHVSSPSGSSTIAARKTRGEAEMAIRERQTMCPKGQTLSAKDFEIITLLGAGDVGRVYLVRNIHNQRAYSLKAVSQRDVIRRNKTRRALTERNILVTARHPFVVTLFATFHDKDFLYYIMEYHPGGELYRFVKENFKHGAVPEKVVKKIMVDCVIALHYLHSLGIIYRDLKMENILIKKDGHICLTDFDLAKLFPEDDIPKPSVLTIKTPHSKPLFSLSDSLTKTKDVKITALPFAATTGSTVGTIEYLAPEVCARKEYTSAVDWWTLGILMFELLYGRTPFIASSTKDIINNIRRRTEIKFPKHPSVSVEAKDLIKRLLEKDPHKRLGSMHGGEEIQYHGFFKGMERDFRYVIPESAIEELKPKISSNPFDSRRFRKHDETKYPRPKGFFIPGVDKAPHVSSFLDIDRMDRTVSMPDVSRQFPLSSSEQSTPMCSSEFDDDAFVPRTTSSSTSYSTPMSVSKQSHLTSEFGSQVIIIDEDDDEDEGLEMECD
ncbi:hypothetical protein ADUPG1_005906, partial [Aduncisulcus paluster]